jgi:hypothetical protein
MSGLDLGGGIHLTPPFCVISPIPYIPAPYAPRPRPAPGSKLGIA